MKKLYQLYAWFMAMKAPIISLYTNCFYFHFLSSSWQSNNYTNIINLKNMFFAERKYFFHISYKQTIFRKKWDNTLKNVHKVLYGSKYREFILCATRSLKTFLSL